MRETGCVPSVRRLSRGKSNKSQIAGSFVQHLDIFLAVRSKYSPSGLFSRGITSNIGVILSLCPKPSLTRRKTHLALSLILGNSLIKTTDYPIANYVEETVYVIHLDQPNLRTNRIDFCLDEIVPQQLLD